MKNKIEISILEDMTEPVWFSKVEPFLQKVMELLNFDKQIISILFCNDSYIQELNKNYRNIDSPTDILSFENGEEIEEDGEVWCLKGDIAISLDTLPVNAKYFNQNENTELKRLLIHGLLHLNGMDHGEEHIEEGKAPVCEMLVLQENLLQKVEDEKII